MPSLLDPIRPWPFGDLMSGSYGVIVIDPPWSFQNYSVKGVRKAPSWYYDTMTLDEIKAMPVRDLALPDSLLLLWTCGWAMARGEAQDVARAWGANPISEMIWRKVTVNGKSRMGTGYRVRTMHEPILVATWGKPKHKALPSMFDGVLRSHSQKPVEFYQIVERKTRGLMLRCNLFSAGEVHDGFEGWGRPHHAAGTDRPAPHSKARQAWEAAHA